MSELKAIELGEAYKVFDDDKEFYLKSEADEYIEELQKKIDDLGLKLEVTQMSLGETKYHIREHEEEEIPHQKRKRCLAMARWCELHYNNAFETLIGVRDLGLTPSDETEFLVKFYRRWYNRWLALADKFKPNNKE